MKLWYNEAAQNWNEALPIGNGFLDAMIFGNIADEHIQILDTVKGGVYKDEC